MSKSGGSSRRHVEWKRSMAWVTVIEVDLSRCHVTGSEHSPLPMNVLVNIGLDAADTGLVTVLLHAKTTKTITLSADMIQHVLSSPLMAVVLLPKGLNADVSVRVLIILNLVLTP